MAGSVVSFVEGVRTKVGRRGHRLVGPRRLGLAGAVIVASGTIAVGMLPLAATLPPLPATGR